MLYKKIVNFYMVIWKDLKGIISEAEKNQDVG